MHTLLSAFHAQSQTGTELAAVSRARPGRRRARLDGRVGRQAREHAQGLQRHAHEAARGALLPAVEALLLMPLPGAAPAGASAWSAPRCSGPVCAFRNLHDHSQPAHHVPR